MAWEGVWSRTVKVPKNVQGRCAEETLVLKNREWKLTTVIHATYECNQPFLEMVYAGSFPAVKIKKETSNRDVRLQLEDIHLVGMSDINKTSGKVALPESAVESLSDKYVPEKYQTFEHRLHLSADGETLEAGFYPPVQEMAIPLYPSKMKPAPYKKVASLPKDKEE